MIKFISRNGELLGLGISAENVKRLKQDQPILVKLEEMNCDLSQVERIMIFYGATEPDMRGQLIAAGAIDGETKVTIEGPPDAK